MKAKFGAIVTDGRGKLGGKVFSKNRYGNYEKIKVTPTNPSSAYSSLVRSNHRTITQTWSLLSDSQRQSWNVGTKNFPQKNTFGDIHFLSGYGLFVKFNINRLLISESILNLCPNPAISHFISSASVEAREIDNTVILNYTPNCPAGYLYKIHATPAISAGINYSNRRFKLLSLINSTDVSPFDLSALYLSRYSVVGPAGQKIFFKMSAVEIASGIESQPFIFSTIILNSLDMLKVSVTLTTAQITANDIVDLIPAPGANKIIIPIALVVKLKFNTTPYSGATALYCRFDGSTQTATVFASAQYNSTVSVEKIYPSMASSGWVGLLLSSMVNKKITLQSNGTIIAGDSPITVDLYYIVNDY